jgi:hypothetical protein
LSIDGAVAIWPSAWEPEDDTKLIGVESGEPTRQRHLLVAQCLVISPDQQDGYLRYSYAMRKMRAMLYRDTPLRLALHAMSEDLLGSTERVVGLDVLRQRHLPARFEQFVFLGHTDIRIITDVVPT